MDFEVRQRRLLTMMQQLSFKKVASSLVVSFTLASMSSVGIAVWLVPSSSTVAKKVSKRVKFILPDRELSKENVDFILKRNIFNSEGKLGDVSDSPIEDTSGSLGRLVKSDLPLKVVGIIFSGDPTTGLASIEDTQKRKRKSYVVGDTVIRSAKIVGIYEERVVFDVNGQLEYIELEEFQIVRSKRKKGKGSSRGAGFSKIATRPPPDSFKEDGFSRTGSAIKLSDEYKRSLLTPDNMAKILQDAKAEPNMVGDELKGFRLTRIRENSIYEKAGFQNNDVIEEINGIPLRDAAGAIRLLQQLKSAKEIDVRIVRGGSAFDLSVEIQ